MGMQMAQTPNAGSGWQSPGSVLRVRLCAEAHVGLGWSSAAHAALEGAAGPRVRIVEGEQHADLLLIAGTAEWAEGFVRHSRAAGDATPIVVLDSSVEKGANARILDAGADDCLACPFDSAELRARVRAVLRRLGNGVARSLEIAANCETLRIRVRDVEARVSRRQFEIFMCLAEHRERWVHSDQIIAAVCGTHHDPGTSLVRVQIHGLRKAIGEARECIRCDGHKRYMLTLATTA